MSGRTAWLLPAPSAAVGVPVAPALRLARVGGWLSELGWEPEQVWPEQPAGRGRALSRLARSPLLAIRARRARPALILTASALDGPALALLKRAVGDRPLLVADVIGLHSLEVEQATASPALRALYRPVWRRLERTLIRSADVVLTVNDRHRELVLSIAPGAAVHTLRDSADEALIAVPATPRSRLGLPADSVAVGYAGGLVHSRLEPLLEAWAALDGEPLSLLVIGDGPDRARYEREAGRGAIFLGALPYGETVAALRACDIAYSDCWSDAGFPAKILDYMALGLPIVAPAKSQIGEVLTGGSDACLYSTPQELAAVLRDLAHDSARRQELGRGAHETFLASHTSAIRGRELAAILAGKASA